jgi:SET domain-containing protein
LGADPGFDIVVRDIKKGEELTYDYRDFYDDIKMQCHCGEKKLL